MRLCGEQSIVFIRREKREWIDNARYTGTIENDCNRAHSDFLYTLPYHAKNHHDYHSVSGCDDHRPGDLFYWMVTGEAETGGGRRPAGNSSKKIVIFFFS
jgi:hypothetical protein